MEANMFEAVRAAEGKAEAVLGDAQRDALQLLKQTETDCANRERGVAREHRALYQSILEEKRAAMAQELRNEAQKEREKIDADMRAARQRLPQAVQRIAERVMNDGNR